MFRATEPAATVTNKALTFDQIINKGKSQILVINRVTDLGSGSHTPTQFFWEYPRGNNTVYEVSSCMKMAVNFSKITLLSGIFKP